MSDEIKYSEFNWKQNSETFFARSWAISNPRAVICIVHGFGEHSGRYQHVAETLCAHGFAVTAMDNFGHGKTTGKRGYSPSFEATMDSIQNFLDETEKLFPGSKKFLWGHSMGGGLVANFILRRQPAIIGAILGSPLFKMAFSPPMIKVVLARIMNNIFPSFSENANLEIPAISRDAQIVKAYSQDPLVHGRMSARTFLELMDSGRWALANSGKLNIPCLHMHGTADRLTSYNASKEFVSKAPPQLLTFKSWEGFYHELHNEPEPDRAKVLEYVIEWMKRHL